MNKTATRQNIGFHVAYSQSVDILGPTQNQENFLIELKFRFEVLNYKDNI